MAATEQFSLRWNNFHSNLTSGFHDLLEAADMVDVTLAVDGHFLQAHKIVLSICSPYFKQLFKINPCKHPIVILKDITHGNMKDILEFMYVGEVNVLRENLPSFLRTAELLQVKGLTGDDSSDASSKKDDKNESVCETDDAADYNQLMDTDTSLLSQYAPSIPSPPQQKQIPVNSKRITKNSFASTKRIKSETSGPPAKSKCAKIDDAELNQIEDDDSEFIEVTTKLDQHFEKEEVSIIKKENFYDGNGTSNPVTGDPNLQDHEGKVFACHLCPKTFKLDDSLRKHVANIHGDDKGPFQCSLCGKASKNRNSLYAHRHKVHKRLPNDVLSYTADGKSHVYCPYCYRKFVNRYNLKIHIRDKHDASEANLDCIVCGKTMRNKSCLRVHMYHHRKQQLKLVSTN